MTRHLQSIPNETASDSVTLRQLAGDQLSNEETDYHLQRKFGAAVYYVSAMNLYALNDHDRLADPIINARGGVLAYYDGLKDVAVERRSNVSRHLGAVSLERRTLACFRTLEASDTAEGVLPEYDSSIGAIMDGIAVELDEIIVMKRMEDILKERLVDYDDRRPLLHIVK